MVSGNLDVQNVVEMQKISKSCKLREDPVPVIIHLNIVRMRKGNDGNDLRT